MTIERRADTGTSSAKIFLEEAAGGPLTLGGFLRAIREGEEMTLAAFAGRLGVSRQNLCDVEPSIRQPGSRRRMGLCTRVQRGSVRAACVAGSGFSGWIEAAGVGRGCVNLHGH
jgi:hypothetical protein